MLNKIGISACLCVLTTCTAELFPIPHKKRIIYGSTVAGRTVFITAPLIGATVILRRTRYTNNLIKFGNKSYFKIIGDIW